MSTLLTAIASEHTSEHTSGHTRRPLRRADGTETQEVGGKVVAHEAGRVVAIVHRRREGDAVRARNLHQRRVVVHIPQLEGNELNAIRVRRLLAQVGCNHHPRIRKKNLNKDGNQALAEDEKKKKKIARTFARLFQTQDIIWANVWLGQQFCFRLDGALRCLGLQKTTNALSGHFVFSTVFSTSKLKLKDLES